MNIIERAEQGQSFIVADDGQFLGKLTLNQYDSESISNSYGSYGSLYSSTSIKNQYSQYGSPYSSLSPFNQYSSTPPIIYLKGREYGSLTKNKYKSGTILDPDLLNKWMCENNLNY
jgi:hypothetical protein